MSIDEGARAREESRLHTLVGSLLVVLIVLMANYLAFRHYWRWDWTQDARYTLSERSLEVVRGLDRDVELILLASEGEPGFADVQELAERYASESPRMTVRQLDPDRQPTEVRRVAQQYDIAIRSGAEGQTLAEVAGVVAAGDRSWKITRDDLFRVDFQSMDDDSGPELDVEAERAITGAIVQVLDGEETHVCLTTGHGEYGMSGERALPTVRDELERENMNVQLLDPLATSIPDECEAVFVLGPQAPFRTDEALALIDWVKRGGRALLALDPNPSRDGRVTPSGFEEPLAELGVLVDPSVFVEPDDSRRMSPDPTTRLLVVPTPHETTAPAVARGGPFVVNLARTVRAEPGSSAVPLLEGSMASFGKVDLAAFLSDTDFEPAPDDITNPTLLGALVEVPMDGEERPGRIVVLGDSDWMQSSYLAEPGFVNLDLMMAWTGWLTSREALVSIPPRRSRLQAIVMSESDMNGIWLRVMGFLPGAMVLLGFAAWWGRRQ